MHPGVSSGPASKPKPLVTSKKRRRRDRLKPPAAPPAPKTTTVEIPWSGPRAFGSGWRLSWSTFLAQLRRPFALLRLMAVVMVVFSLLRMILSYMVNLVGFGAQGPSPEISQLLNQALWNAFGFLLGPAAMTPWFAGRVLFAHGLKTPWRLVFEPLGAPWRWAHLLALGVLWMVGAAVVGAHSQQLGQTLGQANAIAFMAVLWFASQVWFSVASAAVWRDDKPAHWALLTGVVYPLRGLLPLLGMIVAWLSQFLAFMLVLFFFVGAPMVYMQIQGYNLKMFGFVLLPVLILVAPVVFHQRAVMGLALLDWGERQAPPSSE